MNNKNLTLIALICALYSLSVGAMNNPGTMPAFNAAGQAIYNVITDMAQERQRRIEARDLRLVNIIVLRIIVDNQGNERQATDTEVENAMHELEILEAYRRRESQILADMQARDL